MLGSCINILFLIEMQVGIAPNLSSRYCEPCSPLGVEPDSSWTHSHFSTSTWTICVVYRPNSNVYAAVAVVVIAVALVEK